MQKVVVAGLLMTLAACGDGAAPATSDTNQITSRAPHCPSAIAPDTQAAARLACSFGAGALPAETLGLDEPERLSLPIEHVIVMMKENRSFDHLFGALHRLQPAAETFGAGYTNLDLQGRAVAPFHLASTCVTHDPDHQWAAMHAQIGADSMDGYVKSAAQSTLTNGRFVIGYYDENDLPFYYFLASTYAIADHYFPSVRSATFPNRDYLLLGTSDKVTATGYSVWPDAQLPTIFDRLDTAGVTWRVYADAKPFEGCLGDPANDWQALHPVSSVNELIGDLKSGNLPSVVFVDGELGYTDEHPTADIQVGEAWTKDIYDAAVQGPLWWSTAIFLTYDEAGGFFDHVPPASTCVARPEDADFFELGTRVPMMVISPWARRHHVSKTPREHTSITRFIEALFNLPALTARDANSDALFDMFDFRCAPKDIPEAPPAGTGGCRGAFVTLPKPSFTVGESIPVTFANGPGAATDWVGVVPVGGKRAGSAIVWAYAGSAPSDPHTTDLAISQGTVTLDGAASAGDGGTGWPLPPGEWRAQYFVAGNDQPIASVRFDVE